MKFTVKIRLKRYLQFLLQLILELIRFLFTHLHRIADEAIILHTLAESVSYFSLDYRSYLPIVIMNGEDKPCFRIFS